MTIDASPTPAFTHVALHVREVERVAAFYRRFCDFTVVRQHGKGEDRVLWLAPPGRERDFVLVLIPGGKPHRQDEGNFSHLGFALASRAAVDKVADAGRREGCLVWEAREDAYPAGYHCGLKDPNGTVVEFSFGQPLGA